MGTTAIARKLSAIREKSTLSSIDIAAVTGSQPETVSKWNQSKAVPRPDAQRRLLDLDYIVDLLSDLYDQPDDVKLWLISRQKLLGGRIPFDLIHDGKTEEVIAVIDQLRDSVFA
jgi:transcriptional regulator with XRE-family HTH domain